MSDFGDLAITLGCDSLWLLDEASGNYVDTGGAGKDLTAGGSGETRQVSTGLTGAPTGVNFADGAWARIGSTLTDPSSSLSFVGWFYENSAATAFNEPWFCASENASHNDPYYTFYIGTNSTGAGNYRTAVHTGGGFAPKDTTTEDMSTGAWHMLAMVYDGTDIIVYEDGLEVARDAKTGTVGDIASFAINNIPALNSATYAGDRRASNCAYWADTVLTIDQITALYNVGVYGSSTALSDTGLVVRYYLDEATSGTGPTSVADASSNAYDLDDVAYGTSHMSWTGSAGATGVESLLTDASGADGYLRKAIGDSGDAFRTAMASGDKFTVEIVLDAQAFTSSRSRVFAVNGEGGQDPDFGLAGYPNGVGDIYFCWNQADKYYYDIDDDYGALPTGRVVLHAVVDTTQATSTNRVKFYLNGIQRTTKEASAITQNDTLTIPTSGSGQRDLIFLNRQSGGSYQRSMDGVVYYGAMYNVAFTDTRVGEAAGLLYVNDDAPSTTVTGDFSLTTTSNRTTAGYQDAFGIATRSTSFSDTTSGYQDAFGDVALATASGTVIAGYREASGALSLITTFGRVIAGYQDASGAVSLPTTINRNIDGYQDASGIVASVITSARNISGHQEAFGDFVLAITTSRALDGYQDASGIFSSAYTLDRTVMGERQALGIISSIWTADRNLNGYQDAFGAVALSATADRSVDGYREALSSISPQFTFARTIVGDRYVLGLVSLSITANRIVDSYQDAYGAVTLATTSNRPISGYRESLGTWSLATTLARTLAGYQDSFGDIAFLITFSKILGGYQDAFGNLSPVWTFANMIDGDVEGEIFGTFNLAIASSRIVSGYQDVITAAANIGITSQATIDSYRETFGSITPAWTFVRTASGSTLILGTVSLATAFALNAVGYKETFGVVNSQFSLAAIFDSLVYFVRQWNFDPRSFFYHGLIFDYRYLAQILNPPAEGSNSPFFPDRQYLAQPVAPPDEGVNPPYTTDPNDFMYGA